MRHGKRPGYSAQVSREVDIRGDRSVAFPDLDDPLTITHARVLACKYEDWNGIGRLTNLISLEVSDWLGSDFSPLQSLTSLEQLKITHLPRISSLAPLAGLVSLKRLILETIPSWDSSGKVTEIETLAPLRDLPLEEVNLFGVRPQSKAVDDLLDIKTLRRVRLSKFAAKEIKRINALVPNEFVDWHDLAWGSAAEAESAGGSLPTGISFRQP